MKKKRRKKDGAKMELRKNGTINTPFLLSPMAAWTTSRRGGFHIFPSSNIRVNT
jgi:hypothetical protein